MSKDDVVAELPGIERGIPHAEDDNNVALDTIGISHATFSWSKSEPGSETLRNKHFTLSVHDELVFQPKELNLVTGPTGSGKTSLLMALLGEMHFRPSGPSSWRNLPRHLGVAYAAQESWILNQTIRASSRFQVGSNSPSDSQNRTTFFLVQVLMKNDTQRVSLLSIA